MAENERHTRDNYASAKGISPLKRKIPDQGPENSTKSSSKRSKYDDEEPRKDRKKEKKSKRSRDTRDERKQKSKQDLKKVKADDTFLEDDIGIFICLLKFLQH